MKKRHYLTMIMVTMLTGLSMAQAQNPECMTNLSIYAEHVKVKNYDAAYEPWKMVYESCPDINKANFSYGERILKAKIESSTGADKDAYLQDLLSKSCKVLARGKVERVISYLLSSISVCENYSTTGI